ncbi:MAG: hypothetical protein ACRET2_14290, partial [Steroidobacteraceae bacterium]
MAQARRSCGVRAVLAGSLAVVCAWPALANPGLHDRRLTARDLLSLKDIGGAQGVISLSPNGRYVAFEIQQPDFSADTYRSEWYVASTSGRGKPVDVGRGGDLMLYPAPFGRVSGARADIRARWSPNGRWIAFLRKDGDEVQVWTARRDGHGERQVTHSAANVLSFAWRPDSRAIYFEIGRNRKAVARRDRDEGRRGYLLDDRFLPLHGTKPRWFTCGKRIWNVPAVASERCKPRLWVAAFGSGEHKATVAETRAYEHLTASARPPAVAAGRSIRDVSWNPTHTQAAWLENTSPKTRPGFAAPLTLFVANRACLAAQCTGRLEGVWWNGTEVVFLRREGWDDSVPAVYVWTAGRAAPRRIYREDSTLESCAVAAGRLVCLQETPTAPRKIVSIDLADGAVATLYDPNPGFARYR